MHALQVPLVQRLLKLQCIRRVDNRLPSRLIVPVPLNVPEGTSNTPARQEALQIDVAPGMPFRGRLCSWREAASHQLSCL